MQGNLGEILQRLGRDAALPGVELAIELLQELRADLMNEKGRNISIIDVPAVVPAKRLGRPPGSKAKQTGSRGWGGMTPAERSAEMKRRIAVAAAKRGEKIKGLGHPRDPRHPGHAAWLKKIKAAQNKFWNSLTPAQQESRNRKMVKAREANRTARAVVDEIKGAA